MIVTMIMPLVVVVSMIVMMMPVVVAMIVTASAFVTVLMMVMSFRIDQGGRQLALEPDRHVARAVLVLDHQSHHFGTQTEIVDGAQVMPA